MEYSVTFMHHNVASAYIVVQAMRQLFYHSAVVPTKISVH